MEQNAELAECALLVQYRSVLRLRYLDKVPRSTDVERHFPNLPVPLTRSLRDSKSYAEHWDIVGSCNCN